MLKFAGVGRAFFFFFSLREFNENRNWICSLRGITPVAPPTVVLVPGSSRGLGKSCLYRGPASPPAFPTWPRGRTDNQIDLVHGMRHRSPGTSRTILSPFRPARGNWTRNLFHAPTRCAPYVINGRQFSHAQHPRCLTRASIPVDNFAIRRPNKYYWCI